MPVVTPCDVPEGGSGRNSTGGSGGGSTNVRYVTERSARLRHFTRTRNPFETDDMTFAFYCLVMAIAMAVAALVTMHQQVNTQQASQLAKSKVRAWPFEEAQRR